jgi:prophage regulatory protein
MFNHMEPQMPHSAAQRAAVNPSQPIEAAAHPSALLRLSTVEAIVGLKRSAIYSRVKAKTFPEPLRQGTRCTRWRAADINGWLESVK